jgi:hypothetical protein
MEGGESITMHADLDGSESLVLDSYNRCFENITVQRPDGSVSLHLEYPDTDVLQALAIPANEAGTWSVTVAWGMKGSLSEIVLNHPDCRVRLFARPAAVKLDLPKVTNDYYLIRRLVEEMPGTIVVTENGETLSLSQPLTEGRHDLRFQRVLADGRVSEVTRYILTVDRGSDFERT